MEIIAKVSKGSKMDQIYIPKNRSGFSNGSYVVLKPLEEEEKKKKIEKPILYNIKYIEPIKLEIVNEIMTIIDKISNYENIIITGSFLNKGFDFKDIDIIIITENKLNTKSIKDKIEDEIGIKTHLIIMNNKTLIKGLSTDPLYQMMLSRCISKERFIYKIKKTKIDYKILDIHLLKSKVLIDNFDLLSGEEKYYLTRNMVCIFLYLQHKKIDKEKIDKEIIKIFNLKDINKIKKNMLNKHIFLKKYKIIYKKTFNKIIENINGKQK